MHTTPQKEKPTSGGNHPAGSNTQITDVSLSVLTTATRKPTRKRAAVGVGPDVVNQLHKSVIGTGDSYLLHAVMAVENTIGPIRRFNSIQAVAGYVQACASLHAAELIAQALDRNTAALKAAGKRSAVEPKT